MSKQVRGVVAGLIVVAAATLTACVPLPPDVPIAAPEPPAQSADPQPSASSPSATPDASTPSSPSTPSTLNFDDWPQAPLETAEPSSPISFSAQVFDTSWEWRVIGAASFSADGYGDAAPAGSKIVVLVVDTAQSGEDGSFRVDFDVTLIDQATGTVYPVEYFATSYLAPNDMALQSSGVGQALEILIVVPEGASITHWSFEQVWDGPGTFDVELQS